MRLTKIMLWMLALWRGREHEVNRQWRAAAEAAPLAFADLAVFCQAEADTFAPGQADLTAYNAGKRAVWLHIRNQLALDMSRLDAILKEAAGASEDAEGLDFNG